MSRNEFLLKLQEVLSGEIPQYDIDGYIQYYREYLTNPSDGKTEEEKLKELGDPRLIAKTIIDTAESKSNSFDQKNTQSDFDSFDENTNEGAERDFRTQIFSWDGLMWYQKVFAVIIGILIVIAILGIVIVGVNLFFSIILPILIVVFLIRLVIGFVKR
ncbi:MAG: hypothetical protein ACERKN_17835 [Velocimicrobium sp.]